MTSSKFIATDEAVKAKDSLYCIYSECSALKVRGVDETFERVANEGLQKKKSLPSPGEDVCCLLM